MKAHLPLLFIALSMQLVSCFVDYTVQSCNYKYYLYVVTTKLDNNDGAGNHAVVMLNSGVMQIYQLEATGMVISSSSNHMMPHYDSTKFIRTFYTNSADGSNSRYLYFNAKQLAVIDNLTNFTILLNINSVGLTIK